MPHDIYDLCKDFLLPGAIGAGGFIGVIYTIRTGAHAAKTTLEANAKLAKETSEHNALLAREQSKAEAELSTLQHQREVARSRRAIRSCLIGELSQNQQLLQQFLESFSEPEPCLPIRKVAQTHLYDANLTALGELEPHEIGIVIAAYESIKNLSKCTKLYSTDPNAVFEDEFHYNLFVEVQHRKNLRQRLCIFSTSIELALKVLKAGIELSPGTEAGTPFNHPDADL